MPVANSPGDTFQFRTILQCSRADPGAPTNLGDSLLCPHSCDHRPLQVCPQKGCHSSPVHWRRPYRGQHHCGQVR